MSEAKRKGLTYQETISIAKPHNYVSAQEESAPIVARSADEILRWFGRN